MPDLKKLVVVLGLDKNQYSAGLKGAAGEAKTATGALQGSFNSMAKSLLAVAAPAAVFGAISKFAIDGVKEFVAYNKTVRETSEATGTTAEEISRLIQVGDDWGIQSGEITSAMKMMTKNGLQPSIENLAKLADEFVNTTDKTAFAEKAAKLLGRNWSTLVPILKGGGDALRDQAAAISENLLATEESTRKARAYEVAMDNLGDMTTELKYLFADQLLPSIIAVTNALASLGFATLGLSSAAKQGKITWGEYLAQSAKVTWTSYTAADAQKWLADKLAEQRVEVVGSVGGIEGLIQRQKELMIVTDDSAKVQEKFKDQLGELQGFIAGPLREETENYTKKLGELNTKLGENATRRELLASLPVLTDDQRTEFGELKTEYDNISEAIIQTGVEHDLATKKILFNILVQEAANLGLKGNFIEVVTAMASQFGLLDDKTIAATLAMDDALLAFANGAGVAETTSRIWGIYNAIDAIPTEIGIHFTVTQTGDISGPGGYIDPGTRSGYGGGVPVTPAQTGPRPGEHGYRGARGLDMIVPGGYPNDSAVIRATSGEHVTITPAGEKSKAGLTIEGNIIMQITSPIANGEQLYREFKRRLTEDLRTERLRS